MRTPAFVVPLTNETIFEGVLDLPEGESVLRSGSPSTAVRFSDSSSGSVGGVIPPGAGGRGEGRFVRFADAEEGYCELCVGGDAQEECVPDVQQFAPVGAIP